METFHTFLDNDMAVTVDYIVEGRYIPETDLEPEEFPEITIEHIWADVLRKHDLLDLLQEYVIEAIEDEIIQEIMLNETL